MVSQIDRNKTYYFRNKIRLVYTSSFWEGRHVETGENVMTVDTSVMNMLMSELHEDLASNGLELTIWNDSSISLNEDWISEKPLVHRMDGRKITSVFPSLVGVYKLTKIKDTVPDV